MPRGQWQFIQNTTYYAASEYKDRDGQTQWQPWFRKYEVNPYVEYGLTDDLTLGATTFAHRVEQDVIGRFYFYNYGLADTELFARYRLYQDERNVLSVQPLVKLPSWYRFDALPRAGSLEWDAQISVAAGRNFRLLGMDHFADADIMYRYRNGHGSDQFRASTTLGFNVTNRIMLMPQVFGTWRARGGYTGFTLSGEDDFDLVKGQLSVVYRLTETTRLQVGGFLHLHARNTGLGSGSMVALWTSF